MSCPRVPGHPQTAAAPGAGEGHRARVGLPPWPAAPVAPVAPGGLLPPGLDWGVERLQRCGAHFLSARLLFPAGLWLYLAGSSLPCLTLIGSPNFGYRSVHRDLEAQIAIVTENQALQQQLHQVGEGEWGVPRCSAPYVPGSLRAVALRGLRAEGERAGVRAHPRAAGVAGAERSLLWAACCSLAPSAR